MSKTKLYTKLAKAKSNFDRVLKSSDNPYYKSKYADLNAIMEAVLPALEEQNLLLLQPVEGSNVITQIVDVETGESISSYLTIPSNVTDPQKIGAAVTYLRRFGAQSLLNLQAEDDDGNYVSGKTEKLETKTPTPKTTTTTGDFKRPLGKPANGQAVMPTTPTVVPNGTTKTKVWDDA